MAARRTTTRVAAAGLLLAVVLAPPAALGFDPEWLRPRYHYANRLDGPGEYGVGDVTDAIFLNGSWFAAADCQTEGHCFHRSTDLVHWHAVPRRSHGQLTYDTGGLTVDDDGTPVAYSPGCSGYCGHVATDQTLQEWKNIGSVVDQNAQTPWLPSKNVTLCNPAYGQGSGYQYMDTVAPFRAKDGLWHLVAPIQGCEDRLRGVPTNVAGNRAQALLFKSPALRGPKMQWAYAGVFFETNETVVPGRTPWVDFIDSDFFQNVPGAADPQTGVFINSWAGGPHSNAVPSTVWNQVQWWVGSLLANGSFVPAPGKTGAVDYGNYEPSPITQNNSMGIDVASNGGTQYYTCKSGAAKDGKGRRVMFSWLMEGLAGARPHTARTNVSTRALPRDVTLDADTNMLLQRPVPELKSLRLTSSDGDALKLATTLKASAGGKALHVLPFRSTQFEILAKFSWAASSAPASVGLRIVGSDDTACPNEFALIGLNLTAPPKGLAVIDRRHAASGRPAGGRVADSVSSAQKPPHDMGPDIGWDRPGGDFRCWYVPGSNQHGNSTENISSCATACEHEPRCAAWSFIWNSSYTGAAPCSGGKPLHGRYCTLKDKLVDIQASPGSTCGLPERSAGWLKNHTQPPQPPQPQPAKPTLASNAGADVRAGPMPTGRTHQLHAFVDRSTVETFWDNRTTVSAHVWPQHENSDRVALYLECGEKVLGGCATTISIELWKLQGLF